MKKEDDTKLSVKKNMVEMSKTTMDESAFVSIQSYDETTEKIVDKAKNLVKEMIK